MTSAELPPSPAAAWPFPAETRFILDGIAAETGGPPPRPEPSIDWARVLTGIRHHRVAPLMQQALVHGEHMPAEVRTDLRRLHRQATRQSLTLAAELVRLVRVFRAAGLDVLALKGAAWSVLLYGDPCRRTVRDIDLMVRPPDAAAAAALLRRLGYENDPHDQGLAHKHTVLRHPGLGCVVELHTSFDDCDAVFPCAGLRPFETAVTVTIGGEAIPTLAPAAALVFAAFHGTLHFWKRLFWLADMAAAAHSPATDWAGAFALARRIGVEGHLALGTVLAHDLLGAPLPEPMARSPRLLSQARRAAACLRPMLTGPLLAEEAEAVRQMGRFRWLAWELRLFNRMANRRALIGYRVQPSEIDRRLVRLPRRLGFLYYGIRLGRMLVEAVTRRSVAGRPDA